MHVLNKLLSAQLSASLELAELPEKGKRRLDSRLSCIIISIMYEHNDLPDILINISELLIQNCNDSWKVESTLAIHLQ